MLSRYEGPTYGLSSRAFSNDMQVRTLVSRMEWAGHPVSIVMYVNRTVCDGGRSSRYGASSSSPGTVVPMQAPLEGNVSNDA
jgi:hypothetical protein